jgi:hypothetical protein
VAGDDVKALRIATAATMGGVLFGGLLLGCPTTSSGPTSAPTPAVIYSELVAGGCLAASDGGVAAVTEEGQMTPPPSWYTCLAEGGTVAGCGVPCDAASKP